MSLTWTIFIFLLLALADKQISYILIHGSIFRPLRQFITRRMEAGSGFFEKMNELFTCKLCMTAQVAMWFIMAPALAVFHYGYGSLPEFLGLESSGVIPVIVYGAAFFLAAMAVAAASMGVWNLLEYRPEKFEDQRREYEARIQRLRRVINEGGDERSFDLEMLFPEEEFFTFLTEVKQACRGGGCGVARRGCRQRAVKEWMNQWWAKNRNGHDEEVYDELFEAVNAVLPGYFRNRWRYKKPKTRLNEFRREKYERLREEMELTS